jgi:catechol 2,3-dioxygenase-like lactoylglutathione lyase family enzyme
MKSNLHHIQFMVGAGNQPFYRDLFTFLEWNTLYDDDGMLGVSDGHGASLWFADQVKDVSNDYDGPGMNHLGLGADSVAVVDATVAFLRERNVELLFDTPQHRAEFSESEEHTYYQVMFESPDRILIEVVYTGPK